MSGAASQPGKLHKRDDSESEYQVDHVLSLPEQAVQDNECSGDHITDARDC